MTIAPYLGLLVPDFGLEWDMTIDLTLGYGFVRIDQFRNAAGTRVTSDVDVDRYFLSGNLNGTRYFGDLLANVRLGFVTARDDHDAFTESDGTAVAARRFDLGQIRAGGDLAYVMGDFEPFLSAVYAYDYEREDVVVAGNAQPANDADDVTLGLGVRWFSQESMSATLEYNTVLFREDFDSHSIQLLFRSQF